MGLSGVLLKKKEKFNFDKLIEHIEYAAYRSGFKCEEGVEYEKNAQGTYEYKTLSLQEEEEGSANQFLIYIFNNADEIPSSTFAFIDDKSNYQQCINIEDFISSELILKFIYEYLKLNKDDIFYNEFEWHYTFKDIEKIVNSKVYDVNWCYKRPI